MKHGEYFICTKLRMLDYLTEKGFHFERVTTDKQNSRYKNWVYKNSESLESAVEDYFTQCRERKNINAKRRGL